MPLTALVKKIAKDHAEAYQAGSVNQPREYIAKDLVSITDEEVLIKKIFTDYPGFDSTSTVTRNFLNIFYRLAVLMRTDVNEADFIAAQLEIKKSQNAIQAKVGPNMIAHAISNLNPWTYITEPKPPEPLPFSDAFAAIDAEFLSIKMQKLREKSGATVAAPMMADYKSDLKAETTAPSVAPTISAVVTTTPPETEKTITDLKTEIAKLKTNHIEEYKQIGAARIAEMARLDKSLQRAKSAFDQKEQTFNKEKTFPDDLKTVKAQVDAFWREYQEFFKRNLFVGDDKATPIPTFSSEDDKLKADFSLLETVSYKRLGKNTKDVGLNEPEWLARKFFSVVENILKFVAPDPQQCEFKMYHGKLGQFNKAYWDSLTVEAENVKRVAPLAYPGTLYGTVKATIAATAGAGQVDVKKEKPLMALTN